jgi:hypothetical protein
MSIFSYQIAIANNLDICIDSTDKLEKNIRLTMESSVPEASDGSGTARSTCGMVAVNRQELIEKMEQLKKKFQYGIQFAYYPSYK